VVDASRRPAPANLVRAAKGDATGRGGEGATPPLLITGTSDVAPPPPQGCLETPSPAS
jgi:hypothetical protein